MNTTQIRSERKAPTPSKAKVETRLEILVLPVADVDRAKRFYQHLGWRLDADFVKGEHWRVVQLTPPGSACSILFGKGITTAEPGSVQGTFLVVDDVAAARAELLEAGVDVSEVFHFQDGLHVDGTNGRLPGPDPEGKSYSSWASFHDPDGNSWMIQEIKTRLPGRGTGLEVAALTTFLQEAELRHGDYEKVGPKHHWSQWYAGYIVARLRGKMPDEAVKDGALNAERAQS